MKWWEKHGWDQWEVYRGYNVDIWYFRYASGELVWTHHKLSKFWTTEFWTVEEMGC